MKTRIYQIMRMGHPTFQGPIIKRNLTLDEAQAHCSRHDTSSHSSGPGSWFDGYEVMAKYRRTKHDPDYRPA